MSSKQESKILKINRIFTQTLNQIMIRNTNNLFYSPIAIHSILSLLLQGAKGPTKDALKMVLKVPDRKTTADGYNQLLARFNSIENVTILLTNKIYLNENHLVQTDFKNAIVNKFQSEFETINSKNFDINNLNYWIQEKTDNKVDEPFLNNDLNLTDGTVVVSAIYFKGNWEQKFNSQYTTIEKFYLNKTEEIDIRMMHIEEKFCHKVDSDLEADILLLPYANKHFHFVVILPFDKDGLQYIEEKLVSMDFQSLIGETEYHTVQVSLPRFKIECTINLNEVVTDIGLGDLFNSKGNLSGITDNKAPLYINKMVQKTIIEVNEDGSNTGASGEFKTSGLPNVNVNHPFIFKIVYKTGEFYNIVFDGHAAKLSLY